MNCIHMFLKNIPLSRVEAAWLADEVFHQVVCNCIHVFYTLCSPMTFFISIPKVSLGAAEYLSTPQIVGSPS